MLHFNMPLNEQRHQTARIVGVGGIADTALKDAVCEMAWDTEFLPLDLDNNFPAFHEGIVNTNLFLIVVDADDKEGVDAACVMCQIAQAKKILVFSAAFSRTDTGMKNISDPISRLARLETHSDALFVIPKETAASELENETAKNFALCTLLQCLKKVLESEGEVTVDFPDLQMLFRNAGKAYLGVGIGHGKEGTASAAQQSLDKPVTFRLSAKFRSVLVCIEADDSRSVLEIGKAANAISAMSTEDAAFGLVYRVNPDLRDAVKITVIAASFCTRRDDG